MTPPKEFKRCSCCGISITREAWATLKLIGHQPTFDPNGEQSRFVQLQMRNCVCKTTLSIEVPYEPSPAPWSVCDPDDNSGTMVIVSRSGTEDADDVATVDVSRLDVHPNAYANLQLLNAAPDLFAALAAISRAGTLNDQTVIDMMIAALAKARGGR